MLHERQILLAALLMLLTPGLSRAQTDVPEAIKSQLTSRFPGWRLAVVDPGTAEGVRREDRNAQPNLVIGDFDGNGLSDYAVLISYPSRVLVAAGEQVSEAVAFLRTPNGLRFVPLDGPWRADDELHFLPLVRKGARSRDLETDESFVHATDAVSVQWDDRGPCYTYVYRKGEFATVWTCD